MKKRRYDTEIGGLHTTPIEEMLAKKGSAYRSTHQLHQLPKMPFPLYYKQKYQGALLTITTLIYFLFHFLITPPILLFLNYLSL